MRTSRTVGAWIKGLQSLAGMALFVLVVAAMAYLMESHPFGLGYSLKLVIAGALGLALGRYVWPSRHL